MTALLMPVCPSCGWEDTGIKGWGPDTPDAMRRLRCRKCGAGMQPKEVTP